PDAGDGAAAQADDPGGDHDLKGGEDRLAEADGKWREQDDQRRGNLEHERASCGVGDPVWQWNRIHATGSGPLASLSYNLSSIVFEWVPNASPRPATLDRR